MDKMKIVEKKLSEIIPYKNNPRNNDDAVSAVAESIKEFGWKVPIVLDKDGVIVAGHTRAKAAEMLGIKAVPCIIADDLTENQVKAFRLADNKVGELASWDWGKLEDELAELKDVEIDMSSFGFIDIPAAGDLDNLFVEDDEGKQKKENKKTIVCPHCGEEFEI